jgi:hypothetical protein
MARFAQAVKIASVNPLCYKIAKLCPMVSCPMGSKIVVSRADRENPERVVMKRSKLIVLLLSVISVLWMLPGRDGRVGAAEEVRFNRDIRPILSDRCFYCHGPDERNRKAGLRLDTFEGATKDRGGYRAIAPGKPDESELLRRVSTHDAAEVMPPPASKKEPLTAAEVGLLRRWIEQGAAYEGHWAFQQLA